MAFFDKTMKRINIQALREFLLYGDGQEEYATESYEERLKGAYKEYLSIAKNYGNAGENSELFSAMNNILTDHEQIYMEVGVQAGFLLAKDIYTHGLSIDKPIARYEEMYIKLFEEITKVIEVLQEVQQKTEDMYVRTSGV